VEFQVRGRFSEVACAWTLAPDLHLRASQVCQQGIPRPYPFPECATDGQTYCESTDMRPVVHAALSHAHAEKVEAEPDGEIPHDGDLRLPHHKHEGHARLRKPQQVHAKKSCYGATCAN